MFNKTNIGAMALAALYTCVTTGSLWVAPVGVAVTLFTLYANTFSTTPLNKLPQRELWLNGVLMLLLVVSLSGGFWYPVAGWLWTGFIGAFGGTVISRTFAMHGRALFNRWSR